MFSARTSAVLAQQNKIQELTVRASDTNLFQINTANVCVTIGEALAQVVSCLYIANSGPSVTPQAAATMVISDSTALTSGGDAKAIRLTGVASLAANDVLIIKYVTK